MNISELVSFCGLICQNCPIYWAAREENLSTKKKMKDKIAQICNDQYGLNYTGTDITDCDGCRSESGRLFSGCVSCEIRKCAKEKNHGTCAECPEYVCTKLQKLYDSDSSGKTWLDIIRAVSS